jgi:hypothetical protein
MRETGFIVKSYALPLYKVKAIHWNWYIFYIYLTQLVKNIVKSPFKHLLPIQKSTP